MSRLRNFLIMGLVVVILLGLSLLIRPYVVLEEFGDFGHVEFANDYVLDGDMPESLFLVARTAQLGSESSVTGDAALVGGTITVNGHIDGDLTLIGGTLVLGDTGSVGGGLHVFGGNAHINGEVAGPVEVSGDTLVIGETATIDSGLSSCSGNVTDERTVPGLIMPCEGGGGPLPPVIDGSVAPDQLPPGALPFDAPEDANSPTPLSLSVLSSLATSMLLCGLAALAVTVFPGQISHIEEALRGRPRNQILTGVMVFLAMIAVGTATVVLLASVPPLGLLLLPVFLILCLLFIGTVLAGMITLSIVFGGWLLKRVSRAEWPPLVQAATGSVVLSLLLHVPALIPSGWFVTLIAAAALSIVAVGAALSTRMGTRPMARGLIAQG